MLCLNLFPSHFKGQFLLSAEALVSGYTARAGINAEGGGG